MTLKSALSRRIPTSTHVPPISEGRESHAHYKYLASSVPGNKTNQITSNQSIMGRDDFDHYEKGERRVCQGKLCSSNVQTEKNYAVKVCHHEDCQDANGGHPLLLCLRCDEVHHLGAGSSHARFDVPERPSTHIIRTPSNHSVGSDSGNEDDLESEPKVDKKNRGYSSGKRMFKLSTAAKKKPRRHNTEDPGREFFSIKFFDSRSGEFHIDVVPALKGKSLRDSIEPLFEAQDFSFATHSVFLDSSNTPLPLAFDTFPLGGNVLHVRANEDFKVDERVINIVRDADDKSNADETAPRPKSSSFMARSGSFTTKGKDKNNVKSNEEKEKENSKDDKIYQQFNKNTQKGKKNMEALFGKEFGGTMPPSLSSPVLPGGIHPSGGGTLPRPKSASSRLTGLFNQPKTIKGTLKDSLDRYSLYGLEDSADYDCGFKNEIEDQIKLEASWTEVVDQCHIEAMTKKQKDQQEAIWELLSTEAAYISKLYVIKKLFLQCLRNLQCEGFLAEIEASKLFSNVEEIYEVNLVFWSEHLSKVVENARQTKDPLNPLEMEVGFNMFDTQFDPYTTYCMEEANCLKYFKEKLMESEDFRTYITWCEEHKYCTDRLKLNDLLVKPMQRVTKYPLLLKAIHNKTLDDDMKEPIIRMRDKVEAFVSKVNGAMRVRHELEKLKTTADRIHNNYNVVEAVNEEMEKILQDYSSYDLTRPMPGLTDDQHRTVIHEGSLRLVEKQGKMDVYVFLFTDLLLITKAKKGDKFKVIKPPLQVDKLFLSPSKDQGTFLLIYVNEYNIAVQAFALQGSVADQTQWMDAIKKAQKLLMIAKLGQGSSNMLQMRPSIDNDLVSPSGLVTPLGLSPAFPRLKRRSSSASSIISVESDSNDESGFPTLNNRVRSDSAVTSASSTHSSEFRGKDGETEEKDAAARQPQADLLTPEEEQALLGAMARPRSESLGKIARSSSAPQKERPRVVDSSSLSRSSSAPQGPLPGRASSLREGIIMKRRTADEQDGSITSSSTSLNDSAGDSEIQSPITSSSVDFPSLPPPEPRQTKEVGNEPQSTNQERHPEIESSLLPTEEDTPPSSPEKEAVSFVSNDEFDGCEPASEQEENSFEEPQGSEDDSSSSMDKTTGFQALQNLSDSLESTPKSNGPTKQTPHIKSHLIAQHKIQSAITMAEQPRLKKASLPRRSSPVVSRKPRPKDLVRGQEKPGQDLNGILQKIRDASATSGAVTTEATSPTHQERACKLGKLNKRSSESSRAPVKPDKSHYSVSGDLLDTTTPKAESKKERSTPLLNSRKKSMSLSDLLSIGRDLTNNREKNKDKEMDKDKHRPKSSEPISPQTDEEPMSPTSGDDQGGKKEEKRSRFSRLRRKSSRGGELKDGIASGPDIDPKRASRHFFKESLMLETSEYV
ncbi:uncharacterized protein LOC144657010 isoform X4 [Oculina patagonica]